MFADANITKIGENKYNVSYGDDSGIYAEFFWDAIPDEEQTKLAGHPKFKNVEMIKILFPGDNTKRVIRKVRKEAHAGTPSDPERFPRQWAAFEAQQQQVQSGTPIEHWPPLDKAMVLTLKALNIFTVEQLAGISDANLKFMGARQLRDNAKAWLEEANAGGAIIAANNRIAELERQLEAVNNTMRAIGENTGKPNKQVVESLEAPPFEEAPVKPIVTKMRGRPSKVENGADIPSVDAAGDE